MYYFIILLFLLVLFIISQDIIITLILGLILVILYKFLFRSQNYIEGMRNKKKEKKKKKKKKKKKNVLDVNKSILENYKSLSSKQVAGLNSDTKQLINTQKNLMKTLTQMGPVLSQGKSIISAFESYFGKDNSIPHQGADKMDISYLANMLDNTNIKKKINKNLK